jgi:hypothetical protein
MIVGLARSQQRVKHKRVFGRFDGWRLVMDLWMGRIIRLGDGVRIGRRLQPATSATGAGPDGNQRNEREGAGAHCGVGWAGFWTRDHEAAPVAWG